MSSNNTAVTGEPTSCRGCDTTITRPPLDLGPAPLWYGIRTETAVRAIGDPVLPARLIQCQACGLVQQPPDPEVNRLLQIVYAHEFSNASTPLGSEGWGRHRADMFWSGSGLNSVHGRVLEIGCGNGFLLGDFLRRGASRVVGIEPSAVELHDWLAHRPPVEWQVTRAHFSADVVIHEGPFDIVCALAVLEHVMDPARFVNDVRRLLAVSGLFVCVVPNSAASLDIGDVGMFMHEHVNYFTEQSLTALLSNVGFRLARVQTDLAAITITAVAEEERGAAMPVSNDTLSRYALRLRGTVDRYRHLVDNSLKQFGVYGVSNGTANLLTWACSTPEAVLFDTDATKWGCEVSGVHGRIHSPDDIPVTGVTDMVVVPYAYQDEIVRYLRARFPFIRPHPLHQV